MVSGNMWERSCLDWDWPRRRPTWPHLLGGEASLRLVLGASLAGLAILCDTFVSTFEQCTIFSRETRPPPAELSPIHVRDGRDAILPGLRVERRAAARLYVLLGEPHFISQNVLPGNFRSRLLYRWSAARGALRGHERGSREDREEGRRAVLFARRHRGRAIQGAQIRGALVFLVGTAVFVEAKRRRKARSSSRPPRHVSTLCGLV